MTKLTPAPSQQSILLPDDRLPEDARLGRVRLQIADLARSLEYYQGVIGMQVLKRSPGRALLGAHGNDTPLVELVEKPGAHAVSRRGRLGLYHFALLLPGRAHLGRFLRHLSETGVYAGMSDHLFSEALYLTDPDGLGIEVYADRPRSSWRYQGGEIVGDTVPLDVQDLVRAGGEARWAGLPAGTTLGHVHLYVDDLVRARAFYHADLGFDVTIKSFPGALFVSAGGYHHHVGLNTWAAGATLAGPDDARLLEVDLILPHTAQVAEVAERLAARPVGEDWLVTDPWGIVWRLRAEG